MARSCCIVACVSAIFIEPSGAQRWHRCLHPRNDYHEYPTTYHAKRLHFQFLNIVVTSVQNHHSTRQEFSERFKYDVISSSLLSSSITSPSSTRRRSYSDDSPSHDPDLTARTASSPPPTGHPVTHRSSACSLALIGLCLVSLSFDCFLLCIFIGTILYYMESSPVDSGYLTDFMTPVGALSHHGNHTLT